MNAIHFQITSSIKKLESMFVLIMILLFATIPNEIFFHVCQCRGSFATVFKGVSTHDDRMKVAVKEINMRTLGKQQIHDLNMEMNILSQLHHDSIVKIHAVYATAEKTFMVSQVS